MIYDWYDAEDLQWYDSEKSQWFPIATFIENNLGGKIRIITNNSDLLDAEVNVKDTTIDLLDGKANVNDSSENGFDGKTNVKDTTIALFDGKTNINNVYGDTLFGWHDTDDLQWFDSENLQWYPFETLIEHDIMYCDWEDGSDIIGDGTSTNPYKTITSASSNLIGGDEVRVAKSPDDTDLSVTLAFVNGSASITTSIDLTGELIPYDFIFKSSEPNNLLEIIAITPTTITLFKTYSGTSENISAKKLGLTYTGYWSGVIPAQSVSVTGTSDDLRLKISGGWDLTSQIQDGNTFFQAKHATENYKHGTGLYVESKNYLEIEKLNFLRYYYGFELNTSYNNNIKNIICNNNDSGIYLKNSRYNLIETINCNQNINSGLNIDDNSQENNIIFITSNDNNYGIINNNAISNTINNYSGIGNTTDNIFISLDRTNIFIPTLRMQHYQTAGDNRCYFHSGITYRDTVEARSNQCLKFEPNNNVATEKYYFGQIFNFGVMYGRKKNFRFYIKSDAAFNGDVQAALYFLEKNITGWVEILTTDEYVEQGLIAEALDITEESVLSLRIKVRGIAGNIYMDDLRVI